MEMKDINILTVVLGAGGKMATKFNKETGELRIYPNEQVEKAPVDATLYELVPEATLWCMANGAFELESVSV